MRKLNVLSATVAFFISFSLYANEAESVTEEKSQSVAQMHLQTLLTPHLHQEINNVLRENVKLHRYSKDFELIMVNDKIRSKYETMNYMAFRYFKYDVDFVAMSEDLLLIE